MEDIKVIVSQSKKLKAKDENIYEEYFVIHRQPRGPFSNYGYINHINKPTWRLYTILGKTPMVLGSKENFYNFSSFDECVRKLEELSKTKVEVVYSSCILELEDNIDIESVDSGYIDIPRRTSKSVLEQIAESEYNITQGGDYKLELYLEMVDEFPSFRIADEVTNALTYDCIIRRHKARIRLLEEELEKERHIIRPEDIPDLPSYDLV